MPTPKLPAALVAVAGTVATLLAILEPSLPEPWHAIVGGVLGVLSLAGVGVAHRAVRAHGEHVAGVIQDGAAR